MNPGPGAPDVTRQKEEEETHTYSPRREGTSGPGRARKDWKEKVPSIRYHKSPEVGPDERELGGPTGVGTGV